MLLSTLNLNHFLLLSLWLLLCGFLCIFRKRNAIGMLIGVELILNAANLNLIACSYFIPSFRLEGQIFTLLVIVLAAGEAATALAIILAFYQSHGTVDVDQGTELKG